MPLRVVEPVQSPHQIPGDPADAFKILLLEPIPLRRSPIPIVQELRLNNSPFLRLLHIPNLLHDVVSRQPVFVDYLNMVQCVSPFHRNRLQQVHLRVEIAIASDSDISFVHIL